MSTKLKDISAFGAVDADADALLDQCFENHEAYNAALAREKFLLIGRKGSGKTAIFKKINKLHQYDTFSYGHTFTDYPWHHHAKQISTGTPTELCFEQSCVYLVLITLAKIVLNHDQSQPSDDRAAAILSDIESFVLDTYGSRDPDITQVFQPTRKLRINPSLSIANDLLKLGINASEVPFDDFPRIAAEVNNNMLEKTVHRLNFNNKYYICFDELDRGCSRRDTDYQNRLIDLLLAAKRINRTLDQHKRLNVIIFLRDDIYEILRFEDKNKITENSPALIQWDTPGTTHSLKNLMSKRFANLLDLSEENAWDMVFNEEQQMSGHQSKYQHILDRTMLRPRDMIKFCNESLDAYRSDPNRNGKIESIHLNKARDSYSDYLLAEIDGEIHKHISEWTNVLSC